jgi:tRNA nucleotidyltransferase (CCA-adding enzyme)
METPPATELAARARALPGAGPVLDALEGLEDVHLVGGAVRDLLLGRPAPDLDLVVVGDAPAVARTLAERLGGEVVAHGRFGTATVRAGGRAVDLATARRERYPRPGALPEVEPAGLEEDLRRRDFTVNALAIALGPPAPGRLSAAPHALGDLGAGRLRVLHDASFRDDPTRLLRLARYAARLDFAPDLRTLALARSAIDEGAVTTVSASRLGAELRLLAAEPRPVATAGFGLLHELDLDRALHPRFRPRPDVAARALDLLPPDGRPEAVLMAAGCGEFEDAASLRAWLDALEWPAPDRERIVAATLEAPAAAVALTRARRPSEVAAALRGRPVEVAAMAGAHGADGPARAWLERDRAVALEITGADLLEAGVPGGAGIGRALEVALARKLDGEVAGRAAELGAALAAAGAGDGGCPPAPG